MSWDLGASLLRLVPDIDGRTEIGEGPAANDGCLALVRSITYALHRELRNGH
jgi:hypothetical protein